MLPVNQAGIARDVVVIGASAGGVEALRSLFGALPADPPMTIATVLHRGPYAISDLPGILGGRSKLRLSEPENGERMERGRVYVAPRDHHMVIESGHALVNRGPKVHHTRPAVDPLFYSAARAYGSRVVGVLLSGGGDDGTDGLTAIENAGGISIVQNPEEAPHPWMPLTAINRDHVHLILPLDRIAAVLVALAAGAAVDRDGSVLLDRVDARDHPLQPAARLGGRASATRVD